MRYFFLLLMLCVAFSIQAQADTTYLVQATDSTYQLVEVRTDDNKKTVMITHPEWDSVKVVRYLYRKAQDEYLLDAQAQGRLAVGNVSGRVKRDVNALLNQLGAPGFFQISKQRLGGFYAGIWKVKEGKTSYFINVKPNGNWNESKRDGTLVDSGRKGRWRILSQSSVEERKYFPAPLELVVPSLSAGSLVLTSIDRGFVARKIADQ